MGVIVRLGLVVAGGAGFTAAYRQRHHTSHSTRDVTVSVIQHSDMPGQDVARVVEPALPAPSQSAELRLLPPAVADPEPAATVVFQGPASAVRAWTSLSTGCGSASSSRPCNEERNLPYVFARLPDGLHEVIIVDGHSRTAPSPSRARCARTCES